VAEKSGRIVFFRRARHARQEGQAPGDQRTLESPMKRRRGEREGEGRRARRESIHREDPRGKYSTARGTHTRAQKRQSGLEREARSRSYLGDARATQRATHHARTHDTPGVRSRCTRAHVTYC